MWLFKLLIEQNGITMCISHIVGAVEENSQCMLYFQKRCVNIGNYKIILSKFSTCNQWAVSILQTLLYIAIDWVNKEVHLHSH